MHREGKEDGMIVWRRRGSGGGRKRGETF